MSKMKPMLAVEVDLEKLEYPCYIQIKKDGIRCVIDDGVVYSRSLKPIRNKYIQKCLGVAENNGLDGELMVGDPTDPDVFNKTTSGVMSTDGEPDFKLYVFDLFDQGNAPYKVRKQTLKDNYGGKFIVNVPSVLVHNEEELLDMYHEFVSQGYEGAMVRSPNQPYKFGRSTVNSQHLLKLKPFKDAEGRIIGFIEQMENTNEAKKDALGHTERSVSKEGLVPKGTLGALLIDYDGMQVELGTGVGLTKELRQTIWDNQDEWLGKLVKFKYQGVGSKGGLRFPSYQGLRDEDDL